MTSQFSFRSWANTQQDFATLARLNCAQYPTVSLTAQDVERDFSLVDPQRPTFLLVAERQGWDVALVETYPTPQGWFYLELLLPDELLPELAAPLIARARAWATAQGATCWRISVRASEKRARWLRQATGFSVTDEVSEWLQVVREPLPLPPGVTLEVVGESRQRQQELQALINLGRAELDLPPLDWPAFELEVLRLGLYRPELLWLAQQGRAVVGAATVHSWEAGTHAEALWVSVIPEWRGRGLGSALLAQAALAAAPAQVSASFSASLGGQFRPLAALLRRSGFQEYDHWLTLEGPV